MKNKLECPKCSQISFSRLPICKKCGYTFQEYGLANFLDKNTNLLTVFGVFIALSTFIFAQDSQNQNSLITNLYFTSFSIAVITLFIIFIRAYNYSSDWSKCFNFEISFENDPKKVEISRVINEFNYIPFMIFVIFLFLLTLNSWDILNFFINQNNEISLSYKDQIVKNFELILSAAISSIIITIIYLCFVTRENAIKLLFWSSCILLVFWIFNGVVKLVPLSLFLNLTILFSSLYGIYKFSIYSKIHKMNREVKIDDK